MLAMLHGEKPAKGQKRLVAPKGAGSRATADEDDAIEDASDSDGEGSSTLRSKCSFWVSRFTGRLHVLNEDGDALGYNVKLIDWQWPDATDCPAVLAKRPGTLQAIDSFVQQWSSLKMSEQRGLSNQVIRLPLRDSLKKSSTSKASKRMSSIAGPPSEGTAAASSASPPKGKGKKAKACMAAALKKSSAAVSSSSSALPVGFEENAIEVLDSQ